MQCKCGFENASGARFCGSCGSEVRAGGVALATASPASVPVLAGSRKPSLGLPVAVVAALVAVLAAGYWWLHRTPGRHKHDNSGLYRISVNGKDGFMDRSGKVLITPQFDGAFGFSEGLSGVKVGTKFGYINTRGEMVITPQFDTAFPFSEGLAAVQVGAKFGYINTKGLVTITPQFDDVRSFHNGRAAVKLEGGRSWSGLDMKIGHVGNNRYGFIDKDGKYIGMPGLLFVQPDFRDETGWVGDATLIRTADDHIGVMNGSGQVLIADKVDEAGWDGFADGLAPAATGGKWGYLNPKGEWVITPQFESVHGFEDGLAPVAVGQHWGLIDRSGKFVVNPQYDHVFGIAEGYAIVESGKGSIPGCAEYCANYGFISTKGQPVTNATFVQHPNPDGSYSSPVRPFNEGLAAVKTDDGWGFIDTTGKMVVEPQFDSVSSFQDGLASVTVLGKESYITKTGAFVLNPFPGTSPKEIRNGKVVSLEAWPSAGAHNATKAALSRDASILAILFPVAGQASPGDSDFVLAWSVQTGRLLSKIPAPKGSSLAVADSGDIVAVGGADNRLRVFATKSGKTILDAEAVGITAVAFSHDGHTVASGSWRGVIDLWNVDSAEHLRSLVGHTDPVWALAFSPDDTTLASGSGGAFDYTARLWQLKTGLQSHSFNANGIVKALAFSADGTRVAVAGWSLVRVWNVAAGVLEVTLPWESRYEPVEALAFDAAGRFIATSSQGGGVNLWDARSGRPLAHALDSSKEAQYLAPSVSFDSQTGAFLAAGRKIVRWPRPDLLRSEIQIPGSAGD